MAPPVFWVIGEPHEKHEITKVLNPPKTKGFIFLFYGKSLILDLVECVVILVKYFAVKSERDRFLFVESEQDRSLTRTFNKCTFHLFSFHLDF